MLTAIALATVLAALLLSTIAAADRQFPEGARRGDLKAVSYPQMRIGSFDAGAEAVVVRDADRARGERGERHPEHGLAEPAEHARKEA